MPFLVAIADLTHPVAGGNTLLSRTAKQQGLPTLGREKDETHRVRWEKNVLPVVLVRIKYVH